MDLDRPRSSMLMFVPGVVALVLFGVQTQSFLMVYVSGLSKKIFLEPSFSIALLEQSPIALVLVVASVALLLWLLMPMGRDYFKWSLIDPSGGIRWPIFVAAMALAWASAGYRYNYFYDQSHVWDRWLIVILLFGILRSPFLIPAFLFEVLLSGAQFDHPISSRTSIGDQLPIRVLGIVFGGAIWNSVLDGLAVAQSKSWIKSIWKSLTRVRIETHTLVFSILCTVGFFYTVAALGKVMLGDNLWDWLFFSHMENLFVSCQLNGWLPFLSEEHVVEGAELMRLLHMPIAVMTLVFEFGMAFVLVRRRGTFLLLAAISAMHFGIVLTSGIIFWKWLTLDLALLVWLWMRREDPEIGRMYSTPKAIFSVVVVFGLIGLFSLNPFAWWNTKWTMLYEVEVVDEEGEVYRVNQADFSSFAIFDLYKPADRDMHTYVFGMSVNQKVMEFFEDSDPDRLVRFGRGGPGHIIGSRSTKDDRVFAHFMTRYFSHRNRHPGRRVLPFVLPSPVSHNRFSSGPDLYQDQAPVVEARLRFKEVYYTGSELRLMRDEIVYSVPIELPQNGD